MGRHYFGDIEGRFLGQQSSYAADRFGVSGNQVQVHYCFCEDDLEAVENELKEIIKNLGVKFNKLRRIFSKGLLSYQKIYEQKLTEKDLKEFADFQLGLKIRRCLKKYNYCEFEAEIW